MDFRLTDDVSDRECFWAKGDHPPVSKELSEFPIAPPIPPFAVATDHRRQGYKTRQDHSFPISLIE